MTRDKYVELLFMRLDFGFLRFRLSLPPVGINRRLSIPNGGAFPKVAEVWL